MPAWTCWCFVSPHNKHTFFVIFSVHFRESIHYIGDFICQKTTGRNRYLSIKTKAAIAHTVVLPPLTHCDVSVHVRSKRVQVNISANIQSHPAIIAGLPAVIGCTCKCKTIVPEAVNIAQHILMNSTGILNCRSHGMFSLLLELVLLMYLVPFLKTIMIMENVGDSYTWLTCSGESHICFTNSLPYTSIHLCSESHHDKVPCMCAISAVETENLDPLDPRTPLLSHYHTTANGNQRREKLRKHEPPWGDGEPRFACGSGS